MTLEREQADQRPTPPARVSSPSPPAAGGEGQGEVGDLGLGLLVVGSCPTPRSSVTGRGRETRDPVGDGDRVAAWIAAPSPPHGRRGVGRGGSTSAIPNPNSSIQNRKSKMPRPLPISTFSFQLSTFSFQFSAFIPPPLHRRTAALAPGETRGSRFARDPPASSPRERTPPTAPDRP